MELSPGAGRKALQLDGPDSDAGEREDWKADCIEHPAYLPVAALVNCYVDDGGVVFLVVIHPGDFGGSCHSILQNDALAQVGAGPIGDLATGHNTVSLRNLMTGMGQGLGERAVVREEEEARRIRVQPADRVDPAADALHEVHHGVLRVGIADGSNVSDGLVQDEVDVLRRRGDGAAVDANFVTFRIRLRAEVPGGLPVNRYPAGRYQRLAEAP